MGRKVSNRRNRQQRHQQRGQVDRRRGYQDFDPRFDVVVEEEETRYEYGHRVKRQRYPQEVRESDTLKMRQFIQPKNVSQELYLDALRSSRVVIGNGSAGSGKTVLAVHVALEKLLKNEIKRIVITRPVVEAGEELGFLPGTFEQKVLPYMMPMIEAIEQAVGVAAAKKLLETERVVFKPLAYMRGSTFNDCVVIGDEFQNSTPKQMRLLLSRQGFNCYMFVTGDPTQSDLREDRNYQGETGIEYASRKLRGRSRNVQVIDFTLGDVVRDPVMAEVLGLLDAPDPVKLAKPTPAADAVTRTYIDQSVADYRRSDWSWREEDEATPQRPALLHG